MGAETLRFYEQKGLLGKPKRNEAGYRMYGPGDLSRLEFIGRAQKLGFSLQDIKQLLDFTSDIRTPRKRLREFAEARLRVIRRKVEDLRAMEKALSSLVDQCDGRGELKGCPIADYVVAQPEACGGGSCHE